MCYSKEVSLLTAATIGTGSALTYSKYYLRDLGNKANKTLKPFYTFVMIGFAAIGVHQFFEFLSIYTGNQTIYKIGLIASVSAMYFFIRSLELLTKLNFASKIAAVIIALVGLEMFTRPMTFENQHFWVRGNSHIIWATTWMALFLFWNVCTIYAAQKSKSAENKRLLLIQPYFIAGASFILATLFTFGAAAAHQSSIFAGFANHLGMENVLLSFKSVKDFPSVWCAFSASQVFTIPILFGMMALSYNASAGFKITKTSPQIITKLIAITALAWFILIFCVPLISGVALKMVTH